MSLLLTLALIGVMSWRLSSLLVSEEGPFGIFTLIRGFVGVVPEVLDDGTPVRHYDGGYSFTAHNWIGKLFLCIWCMSIWTSAGLYFIYLWSDDLFVAAQVLLIPSTIAIFIGGVINRTGI